MLCKWNGVDVTCGIRDTPISLNSPVILWLAAFVLLVVIMLLLCFM